MASPHDPPPRRPPVFAEAKFLVPPLPRFHVPRRDLVDRLSHPDATLAVVRGSAGSGKSSLLAEWAGTVPAERTVWLTADQGDLDDVRFLHALIRCVQDAEPGFGLEAADLLTSTGRPDRDATESLLADATGLGTELAVVVDDFQFVTPAMAMLLRALASRARPGFRLLLATRDRTPGAFARLRLEDRLVELADDDLRFTREDTATYAAALGLRLSPAEVERLHERTEGWVAGLQLAGLVLRNSEDPGSVIARLSGTERAIAEYLSAEVLESHPAEIRRLLLDTCIAELLTPELAAELSPGNPATLADLEAANLLIIPLDPAGRTYRYHHLFADLLRHRLQLEEPLHAAELHRRAAAFLRRTGDHAGALRHAWRGGQRDIALDVAAQSVFDAYFSRSPIQALEVADGLTAADIHDAPGAALALVIALTFEQHLVSAHRLMGRVTAVIGDTTDPELRVRRLCADCLLAGARADFDTAIATFEELSTLVPDLRLGDDWIGAATSMAARAYAWLGRLEQADAALGLLPPPGSRLIDRTEHRATIGMVRLVQGRGAEAIPLLDAAVEALEGVPPTSTLHIAPHSLLGSIHLELGDIARAEPHLRRALAVPPVRLPLAILAATSMSRVLQAAGEFDAAMAVADEAAAWLLVSPAASRLVDLVTLRRARLLATLGDIDAAMRTAMDAAPSAERSMFMAYLHCTRGRADHAKLELPAATGLPPGALVNLAAVDVKIALTRGEDAQREAEALLDAAEPGRWVFRIAAAGGDILSVTQEAARRRVQTPFVRSLLNSVPHAVPTSAPRTDLLSERERTVLRYAATAMTYREIADELFVSVNTVKTHLRNIHRKLGAESREEVIRRARELHYI